MNRRWQRVQVAVGHPPAGPRTHRQVDTPSPKLYKYFSPAHGGIFGDLLIRFMQLGALNDPFE